MHPPIPVKGGIASPFRILSPLVDTQFCINLPLELISLLFPGIPWLSTSICPLTSPASEHVYPSSLRDVIIVISIAQSSASKLGNFPPRVPSIQPYIATLLSVFRIRIRSGPYHLVGSGSGSVSGSVDMDPGSAKELLRQKVYVF